MTFENAHEYECDGEMRHACLFSRKTSRELAGTIRLIGVPGSGSIGAGYNRDRHDS